MDLIFYLDFDKLGLLLLWLFFIIYLSLDLLYTLFWELLFNLYLLLYDYLFIIDNL